MRFSLVFPVVALTAVLAGCPIYGEDRDPERCTSTDPCPTDCREYGCPAGYLCTYSGVCQRSTYPACRTPADCPEGQNCGTDLACHPGTCSTSGCPSGFVCQLSGGAVSCVAENFDGGSGKRDAAADAASEPACRRHTDCKASEKCLGGVCVPPSEQCFDATQCQSAQVCQDGACTPRCDQGLTCPEGYECGPNSVCRPKATCAGTSACAAPQVCVDEACAPPCNDGRCAAGLECVGGGCVPKKTPTFACTGPDGDPGQDNVLGKCRAGSMCLHKSCFLACAGDAGAADAGGCSTADRFNQCKAVTTDKTYYVCGSTTNLGNECDPTAGRLCASPEVCIDGYCR